VIDGVAITPDGRYAYITNQNSGTVLVIDPGTG
jgi:YVTN family beta-propeller protein